MDRYEEINKLIKQWNKDKSQDKNILKGLYNEANLKQNNFVNRSESLKNSTMFSDLSSDEFINMFSGKTFPKLKNNDLTHLLQEAHNRFMNFNNLPITRNVALINDKNCNDDAYVSADDDLLFVNKGFINNTKKITDYDKYLNKDNLGYYLLYVILHESQHIVQFESSIDFALGKEQDKSLAFVSALSIIEDSNFAISESKNDDSFIKFWTANYYNEYIEHDANYESLNIMNKLIPQEKFNTKSLNQYNYYSIYSSFGKIPTKNTKRFVNNRISKIEDYTKSVISFFNDNIEDCPLKQKLLNTVNSFMDIDENGNSLFRDKLRKELTDMTESFKNSNTKLEDFCKTNS